MLNAGPAGPIDAEWRIELTDVPPSCNVTHSEYNEAVPSMQTNDSIVHRFTYTPSIVCFEPGTHQFSFRDQYDIAGDQVLDPNPRNNRIVDSFTVDVESNS